jgi:hypothetical protein
LGRARVLEVDRKWQARISKKEWDRRVRFQDVQRGRGGPRVFRVEREEQSYIKFKVHCMYIER